MCTQMHTDTQMHTPVHMYACTHRIKGRNRWRHIELCIYMDMHVFIHVFIHIYTHIPRNKTYLALRKTVSSFTREFSLPRPAHSFSWTTVLKEPGKEQ